MGEQNPQESIRVGQGVWHPTHWNGFITHVDWSEQQVYVEWANTKATDVISFDDLAGNWDWKLKQWQLTLGEYK